MTTESFTAVVARASPLRAAHVRPWELTRLAPVLLAAALAGAYVAVSPPSGDLAVHMFRAQLFKEQGFGLWNNLWYSGHHIVSYSVLFPAVSAFASPQVAAGTACVGATACFEALAGRHFGRRGWLAAVLFAAGICAELLSGRLAFLFGALPAIAAILALDRGRTAIACLCSLLTALCSPVAALFCALAAGARALARARTAPASAVPGLAVASASLLPVAALAVAFPEGGHEPFATSSMAPVLALAVAALVVAPRRARTLRAGAALYAMATAAAYLLTTPVGGNDARLGALIAAPLTAACWRPRRTRWLLAALVPLVYLQWQEPVRDLLAASGDPAATSAYYQPLLGFLARQSGPPFRTEIPFTRVHWESYAVATRYPLARGWERQLDIADNPLFYDGRLTAARYRAWLRANAVRFVALPDSALDYSARAEAALIARGLPYLSLQLKTRHWRIYEVRGATPIVAGAARLTALGSDSLTLQAGRPGVAAIRVHFSPYWALAQGSGCVAPAPWGTAVTVRHPGTVRLVMRFSFARIGARSKRCR